MNGNQFCTPEELFKQSPEALAEERVAEAAPVLLAALKAALKAMIQVELSDSSRKEWQAAKELAQTAIATAEAAS
jgi:hypothetical protein